MLTTERGGIEVGLIELCEPVRTLLRGSSSKRHAADHTPVNPFGEIIQMGLIGRLPRLGALRYPSLTAYQRTRVGLTYFLVPQITD